MAEPPLFKRHYRTPSTPTVRDTYFPTGSVLICFRTAKGDFEALTDQHQIVKVQANQLGPPKAPCET